MRNPIPDTAEFQRCAHCGDRNNNWLWRLIERYPTPIYEMLCRHCIAHQERTFLVENVLMQTVAIIAFRQAELSGRCVLDRGEP